MQDESLIHKALSAWKLLPGEQLKGSTQKHLGEEILYQLALPGGLQDAAAEDLEHLSLCPVCLKEWSSWLESLDILADNEEDTNGQDIHLSFGFLKAASASLFTEPISLDSACGRFELSIYPDREQVKQGMIVIEIRKDAKSFENRYCVVRDGTGTIILRGMLEDGRLAGRLDDLSQLDLKTWTVVFDKSFNNP